MLLYDLLDEYAFGSVSSYKEVNPASRFPGHYYKILKCLGASDCDRFGVGLQKIMIKYKEPKKNENIVKDPPRIKDFCLK